jgi:hypothetical protein
VNNKSEDFDEILKGVDAALRRAALKAKEEAERLGTPYVVRPENDTKAKTNDAKTK